MLNIPTNSSLGIYTAERMEVEEENQLDFWYHSFLLLVDLSNDKPIVLQQLHYNDEADLSFGANIREGIGDIDRFRDVKVSLVMQGCAQDVLSRWNYMCGYAIYLQQSDAKFDPDYKHSKKAANCRTAVVFSLRSINVDYNPNYYASEAGTRSLSFPVGAPFSRAVNNSGSLEELLKTNKNYTECLKPNWIKQDRFIDPLPFPLKPMV